MKGNDYIFNHEKLEIYQLSRRLIKLVYKLTKQFPHLEKYNLISQSQRSALSVCLNIVEGNSRYYKKEQAKFADIAIGSLMELKTCIDIAIDFNYINISYLAEFYNNLRELYFKLIAYKKSKFREEY